MLKKAILIAALTFTAPLSLADEAKPNPKYDGIEITVNINTASAQELADLLNGIGLKKAQAIVEYRELHGKFVSAEALTEVKGIGSALVTKNQSRIQL
ncbi:MULTISPECIES: ComEA family DNA-binding protein [Vibrio]|uniref:ComEA family DNA-binding protein n=1 Tax=Vibrio bivalvicida TaxID=1276888 RepID=A0A177XZ94_9VIBR|nr:MULTISPECIES: helix-hairpin-helix domain-containing protein [Vibrio]KLN66270.1 transporter [Vibrio sp. VPAP30]OAJ93918.1 transporter [Vibrio bivalvicida]